MTSGKNAWLAKSKGKDVQYSEDGGNEWLDWKDDTPITFADTQNGFYEFRMKPSENKAGRPTQHQWLRDMEIGDVCDFQNFMRVQNVRCLVSQYGLRSGKKFSVSAKNRTITRIL